MFSEDGSLNIKRRVQQKRQPVDGFCTLSSQVKAAEVREDQRVDFITHKPSDPLSSLVRIKI